MHEQTPLERQPLGTIHLRFMGLATESWAVTLARPACRVEPRVAPHTAELQLFINPSQLDEMLEHGLDRYALRYVGSSELLDHLLALLKAGRKMLDLRFKQQVFHAADAYREAAAASQPSASSAVVETEAEPVVVKPKPPAFKRATRPSMRPKHVLRRK